MLRKRNSKTSPFRGRWQCEALTERASPSPESRHAAISWPFGRAMLSLRLLFFVSVLALSVTFGDSSPKGGAFGEKARLCGMPRPPLDRGGGNAKH